MKTQLISRKVLTVAIAALISCGVGMTARAQGGGGGGGRAGGGGAGAPAAIPNETPAQTTAITAMNTSLTNFTQKVTDARVALTKASLADPKDGAAITAKLTDLNAAETALANARADALAKVQSAPDTKLNNDQLTALVTQETARLTAAGRGGAGGRAGGAGGRRGGGGG